MGSRSAHTSHRFRKFLSIFSGLPQDWEKKLKRFYVFFSVFLLPSIVFLRFPASIQTGIQTIDYKYLQHKMVCGHLEMVVELL